MNLQITLSILYASDIIINLKSETDRKLTEI